MIEKLQASGFEVRAKSAKEHMARIAKDVPMWKEIVAQSGIKLPTTK
jgi:hypothetical protein